MNIAEATQFAVNQGAKGVPHRKIAKQLFARGYKSSHSGKVLHQTSVSGMIIRAKSRGVVAVGGHSTSTVKRPVAQVHTLVAISNILSLQNLPDVEKIALAQLVIGPRP